MDFASYSSLGNNHLRAVWRLSLGLGVVPALAVFLWRLNMEEPTRYKKDAMKRTSVPYLLIIRRYWVSLAAISAVWYLVSLLLPLNCILIHLSLGSYTISSCSFLYSLFTL